MKFCWIYTHFADPFIYWRTLGLLQYFSYCEQSYYELGIQISPQDLAFISFGCITRSVIVGTQGNSSCNFFPRRFHHSMPRVHRVPVSPKHHHTRCFLSFLSFFLDSRRPDGREAVCLCSLDLRFPNDDRCWTIYVFLMMTDVEHLFICSLTTCVIFFGEMSKFMVSFWIGLLCCWILGVFYTFWLLILYQIHDWQISSPILWVAIWVCE